MKIDEYVPAVIPTRSASTKLCVAALPTKYKTKSDNRTVKDVFMDLVNV